MNQLLEAKRSAAAKAYRLILAGGFLVGLAFNLPGHLSVDSVVALHQARTDVRQTWAPAIFSWLLERADRIVAGTGLYVTVSSAVLFASLMALAGLRRRCTWAAPLLALGAVLTPQILIYQGIVWRDVLFANLVIAGFVLTARAALLWGRPKPWPSLLGALVCFAIAAAARQNGLVLALAAAAALGWSARRDGRGAALAWGAGGFAAVLLLALVLNALAQPSGTGPKLRRNAEALILQHYDVVGAVAQEPGLRLDVIRQADPISAAYIEHAAAATYSPARIDTLDQNETMRRALWRLPDATMGGQWRRVIIEHPMAYLRHRAEVFGWVVATPDLSACLPVHVGVLGPPEMLASLQMAGGMDGRDAALAAYARRFYGGPLFSHLAFAVAALATALVLLMRRDPPDVVMAAMLLGAVAFAASFLPISVACDYRYLYVLDLAAITGLLYLALDPGRRRRS